MRHLSSIVQSLTVCLFLLSSRVALNIHISIELPVIPSEYNTHSTYMIDTKSVHTSEWQPCFQDGGCLEVKTTGCRLFVLFLRFPDLPLWFTGVWTRKYTPYSIFLLLRGPEYGIQSVFLVFRFVWGDYFELWNANGIFEVTNLWLVLFVLSDYSIHRKGNVCAI